LTFQELKDNDCVSKLRNNVANIVHDHRVVFFLSRILRCGCVNLRALDNVGCRQLFYAPGRLAVTRYIHCV